MRNTNRRARAIGPALSPILAALALLAALPGIASAAIVDNPDPDLITRWEPCEPNAGVTVIVDFQDLGDHDVQVGCAAGEQGSGIAALHNAGFELAGTKQYGLGFICRIDGLPTAEEQSCNATPPGTEYWSYWHGKPGGQWSYSGTGAGGYKPKLGSVEGWAFSRRLEPGGPAFRVPPQDGSGAILATPPPNPSSSAQLRPAQEWSARRLEALAPAGEPPTYTTSGFEQIVAHATALWRSGYRVDSERFAGAREWLEDALIATSFTTFADDVARPKPERLGPYAIALGALQGGEPTLADETSLRTRLIAAIDPATGGVKRNNGVQQSAFYGSFVLDALASTGPVPAAAGPLVEMIKGKQETGGNFEVQVIHNLSPAQALATARGDGVEGLDSAIDGLAAWVAGLQEGGGGVRQRDNAAANHNPNFSSTAAGAAILGLAGRGEDARAAAFWFSPLQITDELAGGEPGSEGAGAGAADVGAFVKSIDALREAVLYGVSTASGADESTPQALEALAGTGPYGPYHATLDQASLRFDEQAAGSSSAAQAALLTNHDVRAVTIAATDLAGDGAADFMLEADGCLGEALQAGESCAFSARFAPGATGFRQATAQLELGEDGQVVELALEGVALPAEPEPEPASEAEAKLGGGGDASLPSATVGRRSIHPAKRVRMLGPRRIAAIATIACPQDGPCRIAVPRRVPVTIAGRAYALAVLAPRRLAAGRRASLWVRLSGAARRQLAGRRASASVRVRIASRGGTASRTVRVTIGG